MRFAEIGKQVQEQRSVEYWKSLEAMLPVGVREKILKAMVLLQQKVDQGKLKENVAVAYRKKLVKLGVLVHGELDNISLVTMELVKRAKQGDLRHYISTYNYYREANGIKEKLDVRRDKRRPLPVLTPESTLQASLVIPTQLRWSCYFRLLYECGPRPCEPFQTDQTYRLLKIKNLEVCYFSLVAKLID